MQYKSTTLCGMAQKNDGENLMNDNIFVIGGQVKGPSFIGRKKLVQKYRSDFIGSDKRRVYSIVGLSRSGKTSFVKEVFEEPQPVQNVEIADDFVVRPAKKKKVTKKGV